MNYGFLSKVTEPVSKIGGWVLIFCSLNQLVKLPYKEGYWENAYKISLVQAKIALK